MNEEILEGNKLIMEFDGWVLNRYQTLDPQNNKQNPGSNIYYAYEKEGHICRPEDIEFDIVYHQSWNALMPVVEKISQIEYERYEQDNGLEKYIEIETAFPRTFGMVNSRTGNPMFRFNRCQCFEAPSLIEVTWLAVVDFIKNNN